MGIPAWQSRHADVSRPAPSPRGAAAEPVVQVQEVQEHDEKPVETPKNLQPPALAEVPVFADWLSQQPMQLSEPGRAALWGSSESGLLVLSECLPGTQTGAPVTQPFFGPHGKMFDAMLKGIGLGRRQCNIAALADSASTADASLSLDQFIAHLKPRLVLFFCFPGGCGGRANFSNDRLKSLMQIGPSPCVASYHPLHLLDHPELKRNTWEDLKKVRQLLAGTNNLT